MNGFEIYGLIKKKKKKNFSLLCQNSSITDTEIATKRIVYGGLFFLMKFLRKVAS